jgi:hypothetical protein
VTPIIWFIISTILEVSNDFFSQGLLDSFGALNLLFLRNFFSAGFLIFLIRKAMIKLDFLKKMFISAVFIGSLFNWMVLESVICCGLFIYFCRKDMFIWRTFWTFWAFYLTTIAMNSLDMLEISSAYYSIPIFSALLSIIIKKTATKKLHIVEIIILIHLLYIRLSPQVIVMLLGCLCFSITDILIQNFQKSALNEIFLTSICMSVYTLIPLGNNTINITNITGRSFVLPLVCLICGSIAIQMIIFKVFKKTDFCQLLPFRFIGLIYSSILTNKIFSLLNCFVICAMIYEIYCINLGTRKRLKRKIKI